MDVPAKTKPRLFLIDGYALIYRAFFAMISRPLTTTRGENTSAAFGFVRFLLNVLEDYEPDYLGVVLDAGTSERSVRYPEYKATREKMPDDLRASLPRIRDLIEAFRIPVIQVADHEADDVIGTLARKAAAGGLEAVIVSGDKDFYQLIGPGIALLNPGRGGSANVEEEWVDENNASERLGVPPAHVVDYLALIGDSSDNIPGARGIGPKTAVQLIEQYGGVHAVLDHVDEISGKRAREALQAAADDVRLSHELITIRDDVDIELDLEALRVVEPDRVRLRDLFVELEFHSLARELGAPEQVSAAVAREIRLADSLAVAEAVAAARASGECALHVEGSSPDAMRGEIVGIAIAAAPGLAWYLPFAHRRPVVLDLEGTHTPDAADAGSEDRGANLPALTSDSMRPLVALLEDAAIDKIGHDLKRAVLMLRRAGVTLRGIAFDTQVASYVIEPGRRDHELESLALQHLKHRRITREEVCGKGKDELPLAEVRLAAARDYLGEVPDLVMRLRDLFVEALPRSNAEPLFRDVEMPLLPVLAEMESAGIRIDVPFFRQFGARLARDLQLIEEEIYKVAGESFNINSTPQLRAILFDRLGLPVQRKTKTGPSTDASVLEELAAAGHQLPRLILEFRQLDKLKGTYVDALPLQVNPATGRIHTVFSQTVAATGRLSSSDPNLQNIPIRTQVGAEIRKGFIPADGCLFLSADYAQIELRILAHMSGDPVMVEAFRTGVDVHRQTAALVFGIDIGAVTAAMRAAAKTVNFATIYGIGPFALSQQLGTSVADAKTFIENYFARLPGVRRYLDGQIALARQRGYVETLSERRRYIPEVHSKNWNIRQFGERAATNAPVQGTAADIIKIAMIRIDSALREQGRRARMLLQVHDELVFEVEQQAAEETRTIVRQIMETAFPLDVPLEVHTGIGATWFDCK
ncbi:MAG: DNA polymerase I [Gemmatimonadetes bacterium]|nr:DNA polymerase I [Gemmatimonadota bacterium]